MLLNFRLKINLILYKKQKIKKEEKDMENASKALIIAGAILISILLIGVGMLVFQGAQGGIDEAISSMSENEKTMFNNKFVTYVGTKVKGSNVRQVITNIINSNNTNQDIDGKLVSIAGDQKIDASSKALNADKMSTFRTEINTGATYEVSVNYNDKTGLVDTVTIKKNS